MACSLAQRVPVCESENAEVALVARHAGKRLLLVEDDLLNQEIIAALLADVGVIVEIAGDGAEALLRMNQASYDLILMDLEMPKIDGLETTRRIRAQEEASRVPIIAMTANACAEYGKRCLAVGMNGVVTKPFSVDVLYRALLAHLSPAV